MSHKTPYQSTPANGLKGTFRVPGDKSISHRSLICGALSVGETIIEGLLASEDVMATASAMSAMGAQVTEENGIWHVHGVGVGGLSQPEKPLDFGNAGTGVRLCMGLIASHNISAELIGDESLSKRPMRRVLDPLCEMGASVSGADPERLPLTLTGTDMALPLEYKVPVPSAQVKSAVLLAGLNTAGITKVIEPVPTRDHTEKMLDYFGAEITTTPLPGGGTLISLKGHPELTPQKVSVPADPSSAAFLIVASLITENSDLTLTHVLMSPSRTGLITTLKEMGGDISISNERELGGEPMADLRIKSSKLKGISVPPERAPSMIDEYPILSIAAAIAEGVTHMQGLEELRVKESDRLAVVCDGLAACGVQYEAGIDDLKVTGGKVKGGRVKTHLDHRIAMSFLVLGLVSSEGVEVDDTAMIATSFPNFINMMNKAGCDMHPAGNT